jgi:hypothetical protein
MDTKYVFSESQRFRQWWLLLLMVMIIAGPLITIYFAASDSTNDLNSLTIYLPVFFTFLVAVFVFMLRLETRISDAGVSVKFFPITKERHYPWSVIERAYVTKYNPLTDYGGYGLRNGAWNVSGNKGLQLNLKTSKRFLIGTQKADEMQITLNKYADRIHH